MPELNHKIIYEPDARIRKGLLNSWKEMFREQFDSRGLVWRLFVRNFLARNKQSALGAAWAVAMPLAVVGVFAFLNRAGIMNVGATPVPYPVFALLGLTFWQLFATGLAGCTGSVAEGGGMVVKINFPKEALVISALAQAVFEFIIRLALVIAVFWYYGVTPSRACLLFPLVLVPLVLLTLGLGFLFSLLHAVVRDTLNVVTLALTFLLFLTPVLYPASEEGLFAQFNFYNPLAALITGARDLVLTGHMDSPLRYAAAALISLLVFFGAWRIFHLVEPKMAERI